jgi:hypothetical protein
MTSVPLRFPTPVHCGLELLVNDHDVRFDPGLSWATKRD